MKKLLTAAGVAAFALAAGADTYQFIVSGWPAADARYPAASGGTALETATRRAPTAARGLEARYRTRDESAGIALRSDAYRAMIILVK